MMKLINLTSLVGPHTREELAARSLSQGWAPGLAGVVVVSPAPPLPRAEPGRHKNTLKVWGWWWWWGAGNGNFFSQRGFASFHF